MRNAQKSKKFKKEEKTQEAHRQYIELGERLIEKLNNIIINLKACDTLSMLDMMILDEIRKNIAYAQKFISLIERRVLNGEKIPHSEKIFSIFEEYTRWISKGKAGVAVEFGLPVSIIKDGNGYILGHKIMETESDVDVAYELLSRVKGKYPYIKSCSFDKGYWSPDNYKAISEIIETPIMPKKGNLNKAEKEYQSTEEFKKLRKQHSSVESSINALNHSGLDKCYDKGLSGFKRCVSLSILARNLQTFGNNILESEKKKLRRKKHTKRA